jgi:hypothetical protein
MSQSTDPKLRIGLGVDACFASDKDLMKIESKVSPSMQDLISYKVNQGTERDDKVQAA